MTVTPHRTLFINQSTEISTLSICIVDQIGDLVNLRGGNVSVNRMVIYKRRRSLSPQPSLTNCEAMERGSTIKRSTLTLKSFENNINGGKEKN